MLVLRRRGETLGPVAGSEAAVRALSAVQSMTWTGWTPWSWNPPKPEEIARTLDRCPQEGEPRARVLVLGDVDVPEIGELHFEPEVLPATRMLGKRLISVGFLAIIVVYYVLIRLRLIPALPIGLSALSYVMYMGIAFGGVWIWQSLVRPTYLRLAPGVVEFMKYRWFWHRRADVERYPMEAGTVVIVQHPASFRRKPSKRAADPPASPARSEQRRRRRFRWAMTVTLLRDGRKKTISLKQLFKPEEFMERLWAALLSTTPRLSEEDLLG